MLQGDKQGHTRMDRTAIYGRSSDQKQYPVNWIPHEHVPRQTTKAGSLLSTVFWSQKERAPSSPVHGYRLEKPEVIGSSLCRIATDSMMMMMLLSRFLKLIFCCCCCCIFVAVLDNWCH